MAQSSTCSSDKRPFQKLKSTREIAIVLPQSNLQCSFTLGDQLEFIPHFELHCSINGNYFVKSTDAKFLLSKREAIKLAEFILNYVSK